MDLTTFEKILQLVENHGISLVMLILMLLVWFIPWVKDMQERDKRRRRTTDYPYDGSVILEQLAKIDSQIDTALAETAVKYGAKYSTLFQFHNGVVSFAGVPFLKMTATHQYVTTGMVPDANTYKDIPLSLFADVVVDLAKNKIVIVHNSDKAATSPLNGRMDTHNVSTLVLCGLFNLSGHLIGAFSVSTENHRDYTKAEIENLKSVASRISIGICSMADIHSNFTHTKPKTYAKN